MGSRQERRSPGHHPRASQISAGRSRIASHGQGSGTAVAGASDFLAGALRLLRRAVQTAFVEQAARVASFLRRLMCRRSAGGWLIGPVIREASA